MQSKPKTVDRMRQRATPAMTKQAGVVAVEVAGLGGALDEEAKVALPVRSRRLEVVATRLAAAAAARVARPVAVVAAARVDRAVAAAVVGAAARVDRAVAVEVAARVDRADAAAAAVPL